jgi:hypothetical protein
MSPNLGTSASEMLSEDEDANRVGRDFACHPSVCTSVFYFCFFLVLFNENSPNCIFEKCVCVCGMMAISRFLLPIMYVG